jgi:hypothetical protein
MRLWNIKTRKVIKLQRREVERERESDKFYSNWWGEGGRKENVTMRIESQSLFTLP